MKTLTLAIFFIVGILTNIGAQIVSPRIFVKNFQLANGCLQIDYGFENCSPNSRYTVWAEVYNDKMDKLDAKSFVGDRFNVTPSLENKKIDWLFDNDSVIIDDKIYIKIFASQEPKIEAGNAYLLSTLYPGLGHKASGGKNRLYLGVMGYMGIGGSFLFNNLANTALNNYKNELDPVKSENFRSDAKKFQTLSFTSIGVSASIWAIDYLVLRKNLKKNKNLQPQEIKIDIDKNKILASFSDTKYISTRGLPPNLFAELSFSDDNGNGILEASENAELTLTLTNQGKGNAYNLNFYITDENEDKGLKIGKATEMALLRPNESKKTTFRLTTDIDLKTAEHKLQIRAKEKYGYDMDPAFLILQSQENPTPKLSFSGLEILDAGMGTSSIIEDGQLQPGEMVKVKIIVQNTGKGISKNTKFNVSTTDENIFLNDNSGSLGTLNPTEVKEIYISLSPNKRVNTQDYLSVFLDLKEESNKGNLISYRLPIKLNQKPSIAKILTVNADSANKSQQTARFEYNSKRILANTGNLINIKSVIPSKTKRSNSIAVVFGVASYENMAPAPYADNDANIMKEYFEKVLGVEKVYVYNNNEVTISRLNKIFNPDYGDLQKAVIKGETEVFVYFSGHGIPDKAGENTYLFPFDGIKEDLETFGYNTNKLYENLCKLEAKKVTVILDACFSGSSRSTERLKEENLIVQKGVIIKTKKPWLDNKTFTMINSSSGLETSLGFDQIETGLFTYYLCAGLQGKADENGDKKITLGELKRYTTSKVIEHSKKIAGIQTAEFAGDEETILVEY